MLFDLPASLLLLLLAPLTASKPFTVEHVNTYTTVVPSSTDDPHSNHTHILVERGCANPCGYYGQVCCQAGESCFTDANSQAQCGPAGGSGGGGQVSAAGGGSGYWQYFTSTYVETNLVTKTSVYSSWMGGGAVATQTQEYHPTIPVGATATAGLATCDWSGGESSCGNICCSAGQYCQVSGQCAGAAGGSVSAPLRPTMSGSYTVQTQTQYSTTTTQPFIAPIATGQNAGVNITSTQAEGGGGLSGGAIAGIVIGVLLALILLALLIFFCCIRGLYKTFFGGGGRRKKRETIVEEHYHRSRGGTAGGRSNARWVGTPGPRRVVEERRTTRKGFAPAFMSGGIGGVFGGNKSKKTTRQQTYTNRRRDDKSDLSSSYYSESYSGTSESYPAIHNVASC